MVEMKLPRIGMTMEEATIVRWYRQVGDPVQAGEPLYEFETEKVTQVVESPMAGRLAEILAAEGADVAVDAVVCVLATT